MDAIRGRWIPVAVAVALGATAQGATALDYNVAASDGPGLQTALTSAASTPDADRIILAGGIYDAGAAGFAYAAASPVEIIGAGQGVTTLTSSALSGTVDLQSSGPGSVVMRDLTVLPPAGSGVRRGVFVGSTTTVEDVTIDGAGAGASSEGIGFLGAGTVRRVTIRNAGQAALSTAGNFTGSGLVEDSVLDTATAFSGVFVPAQASLTVRRTRIRAERGVRAVAIGTVSVSDSLIEASIIGVEVRGSGAGGATFVGDRLTIIGPSMGVVAINTVAGAFSNATLRGSIVDGTTDPFTCFVNAGTASIVTDYVNAPATGGSDNCAAKIVFDHFTSLSPGFVDAANGDYRLRYDSPLIDAGDPAGVPEPAPLDLARAARVVDGDGNGVAVPDRGAYEYQRRPPTVTVTATPTTVQAGGAVAFSASATDPDPLESAVSYAWGFDDGASATGADVTHVFSTAGTHVATVTVTDTAGASSTATVSVVVTPGPVTPTPTPTPQPTPQPTPDTTAPTVSGLRVVKRIVVSPVLPRVGAAYTKLIRFRLTESARVAVRFERRVGTTWKLVPGSFVVTGRVGLNGLRFGGRLNGKVRLKPGKYRIRLVATDAAGNRSTVQRAVFVLAR